MCSFHLIILSVATFVNVVESTECQVDLQLLFGKSFGSFTSMSDDATGKLPAGLLVGNWVALGHFDECQSISEFKFCLADLHVSVNDSESIGWLSNVFHWGLCVPQSCSDEVLSNSLTDSLATLPLQSVQINRVLLNCAQSPVKPYDHGFYGVVVFCSILVILIFTSGVYDEYCKFKIRRISANDEFAMREESTPLSPTDNGDVNKQHSSFPTRIFLCFAINRNLMKLLNTTQSTKAITCLNGIRVVSILWVIFGHTSSYQFSSGIVDNPARQVEAVGEFWMQIAANTGVAVDSFFFLGGLLVSYLTLEKMKQNGGSISLISFYLYRFLRILPSYMFIIVLFIFIVPYLSQGPIWFSILRANDCRSYWWTNMLFINNFYPISFRDQCIEWSWYLANDMQFYVISSFLLVVLYKSKFLGISLVTLICCVSIATTFALMAVNEFPSGFLGIIDQRPKGEEYVSVVYAKPYCRISPYMVGLLLGYGMTRLKANDQVVKLSPVAMLCGWGLSVATMILVVFGLYPSHHGDPITVAANSIYEGLSRISWAIALAWVVFACFCGYGGWINKFLSFSAWVPLSRLVFTTYLVHPILMMVFFYSAFQPIHYSYTMMCFYFFAFVLASFSIAGIVYILVELPFSNLVELFSKLKKSGKHKPYDKKRTENDEQV
ncbi:nose resistant to fluoxetine protein 6-like [Antedon mediterranea]|uniref:nose resistant to fluoxetine protein 6-like n=1 Tax=Antedon mediterranea TaxID=105859 RepID=UPI003AF579A8